MDISGPLSISPSRSASSPDLNLRPFQRVTAQVLAVNGTTAVLAIEGHAVVAQLSSADQAAVLHSQRSAQFIVSKLSGQEITLKFIRHDISIVTAPGLQSPGAELAVRLLEQNNIPVSAGNLALARAVLTQGLPPTPGLLQELLGALSNVGRWGESQANLAAALKAAGLPVSAGSLALAARQGAQTGEALGQLISQLQSAGQNLPPDLLKEIQRNVQMLEELILEVGGNTARLGAQLETTVGALGQSLEHSLLEGAQNPDGLATEKSLLSLASLGQSLRQAGETDLAEAVEKFLGDLRRQQFLNAKAEPEPGRETWLEIGFRLGGARGGRAACLRICRDSRSNPGEIDPTFTRLVLQVDISQEETVEIDLALAGKGIRAQVTAPDPLWRQQAECELPSLEQALQELGYRLKEASVSIGKPQPFEGLKVLSGSLPLMTVNIEA
jgi:hypothetical protein